jgi:hypothetical protein
MLLEPTVLDGEHSVRVFDLHGLHPVEGTSTVKLVLRALLQESAHVLRSSLWACFLTGTRSHSLKFGRGGGSLTDAVYSCLTDKEWLVDEVLNQTGEEGNGGRGVLQKNGRINMFVSDPLASTVGSICVRIRRS